MLALPATAQLVLYNNGPDADIGYSHVNFGASTSDSFVLAHAATLMSATFTIYAVDDSNPPERVKWTITTEPFSENTVATGDALLGLINGPYITHFGFFGWEMGFRIPDLGLPPGTYWLQVQDVTTRYRTWAFWAESTGTSAAYHMEVGNNGYGTVTEVTSNSFAISGQWMNRRYEGEHRR